LGPTPTPTPHTQNDIIYNPILIKY